MEVDVVALGGRQVKVEVGARQKSNGRQVFRMAAGFQHPGSRKNRVVPGGRKIARQLGSPPYM